MGAGGRLRAARRGRWGSTRCGSRTTSSPTCRATEVRPGPWRPSSRSPRSRRSPPTPSASGWAPSSPRPRSATPPTSRRWPPRSTCCPVAGSTWAWAPAGRGGVHGAFGYEFGTVGERFDILEETLEVVTRLFAEEEPANHDGKRVAPARRLPAPPAGPARRAPDLARRQRRPPRAPRWRRGSPRGGTPCGGGRWRTTRSWSGRLEAACEAEGRDPGDPAPLASACTRSSAGRPGGPARPVADAAAVGARRRPVRGDARGLRARARWSALPSRWRRRSAAFEAPRRGGDHPRRRRRCRSRWPTTSTWT